MSVLILTEESDVSADYMVRALQRRSVDVFRVDLGWFPAQLSFTAELRGSHWAGHLHTPAHTINLEDIHSIWYRAPTAFQFPDGLTAEERRVAFVEAKLGLGGVLASIDVLWVNHPARAADAAYKPLQLVTAARCGLEVPRTLVSNEQTGVREFAAASGTGTVRKLFGGTSLIEHVDGRDVRRVAHTHRLGEDDLADLRGVETTAHQLQDWVPKAYEVRLTAVGDRLFSVAIHAGSASSKVDWRTDYDALRYEQIDTPAEVADGVHRYLSAMGLVYGAFDFVVTPDDRWVFLECNPGGQYGWLEEPAAVPITDSLADLLATGSAS
ncbi:ATP-grasp ribosomal peptide maturase [Saccharopolyspora sp. WRP15-2]|uniref:ATP-grasp ribosomal peptide maturase n=1 Tax=Saccharopolyspora oryzae TaxID=2997343 RepID=A0ABT4URC2_9PSEU|nr:ATP-grasp ribosomal peptide maturase [Saccharopolyspora oryzae]MDA3624237.1 ATP-grasp ribosomal peptide maturase [Saccharopolyspora oryzae]